MSNITDAAHKWLDELDEWVIPFAAPGEEKESALAQHDALEAELERGYTIMLMYPDTQERYRGYAYGDTPDEAEQKVRAEASASEPAYAPVEFLTVGRFNGFLEEV